MNELIDKGNYIFVNIEPILSLEETASKLNAILGSIHLKSTDKYDEVPSYNYETEDFDYVLFGIPNFEDQIINNGTKKYQFEIFPNSGKSVDELKDVSIEFSKILESKLKVKCSVS
jgi:hypothetical protein